MYFFQFNSHSQTYFLNFISNSLNHPYIILKTNFIDIHNFKYSKILYKKIEHPNELHDGYCHQVAIARPKL